MKYYIVCSQPRSGSNFLRSILLDLRVGNPTELFFQLTIMDKKDPYYIKNLKDLYRKGNGKNKEFWGTTIHWNIYTKGMLRLKEISGLQNMDDFRALNSVFPGVKFIYLYRLNKVKQAISWTKAHQSGDFIFNENSEVAEYSRELIDSFALRIIEGESMWMNFFEKHSITPHILTYESLCENRVKNISGILDFLGVSFNSNLTLSDCINEADVPKRQYDTTSEEWYQKYIDGE